LLFLLVLEEFAERVLVVGAVGLERLFLLVAFVTLAVVFGRLVSLLLFFVLILILRVAWLVALLRLFFAGLFLLLRLRRLRLFLGVLLIEALRRRVGALLFVDAVLVLRELILLLLLVLRELLLRFFRADGVDDDDVQPRSVFAVGGRLFVVFRLDPEFEFVSLFETQRREREIVRAAEILAEIAIIEQPLIDEQFAFLFRLERDEAEQKIGVGGLNDKRDGAVGGHFEIARRREEHNVRRLIGTDLHGIDGRVGVAFLFR